MKKLLITIALALAPLHAYAQPLPDGFSTVQAVYATGKYDISTHDGQAAFTDAVVCALNKLDSRWGHLKKYGNQTQIHGHAEDSVLFSRIGEGASQSVDFIGGAGAPGAQPAWTPDQPRYSERDWLPPHNCDTAPSEPTPFPTPVVDLQPVLERIEALRATLGTIVSQLNDLRNAQQELNATVASVSEQMTALASRPFPAYRGSVLGFPVTLRPVSP